MTTRREPLFRFYVKSWRGQKFGWTPATRGGLPVLCNRDELAPDSPVEAVLDADVPFPFEVLIPEKTFSDLDGATDPGSPAAMAATPGEFAARWNSWDEQKRATFLRAMQGASERAMMCEMQHDGVRWVPTYTG